MEVRDPVHGAIVVRPEEVAVLDHPFVQRLRGIRQVGFSELPFPGAVHSRYLHSVGVMHLAGKAFDHALGGHDFSSERTRAAWRGAVRLAALLHDLGHAPFSHCTEFAMPPLSSLGIEVYRPEELASRARRRATHEDYTVAILTRTDIGDAIRRGFPFTALHVAALISREVVLHDGFFHDRGLDFRRVLSQIISSELDVDRLDYLVRDSYFTGARYGLVDHDWLLSNLGLHRQDGQVSLALDRRAIYAFDDFMVSRYHMFVMVYFHHKSIAYEEMLKRYFQEEGCDYRLPADMDAYLHYDDIHLCSHLRASASPWARAIVERRPWRRLLERHGTAGEVDLRPEVERLAAAGIDCLHAGSVGQLSRYTAYGRKRENAPPIFVLDGGPLSRRPAIPLEQATRIFRRYEDERHIARVYVEPGRLDEARRALGVVAS